MCIGVFLAIAGAVADEAAANPTAGRIDLGLAYTADLLANLDGGIKRGTALLGKLDATAEMDSPLGIEGAAALVNLQFVHGRAFSEDLVGDGQITSNIEATSALRPLEAWLELPLPGKSVRAKIGLVDLNSEFDVQSVGALFLNSSHGIGPDFSQSGLNGPSIFPTTSGAVVLSARARAWTARLGLFDAVAGDPLRPKRVRIGYPGAKGVLVVAELAHGLGGSGAVKLGAWSYSTRFDALDGYLPGGAPRRLRGNRGAYATIEGRLADDAGQSLDGWLRIGAAEKRINPVAITIGGGLVHGNDDRRIGIAFSHARLGTPGRRALAMDGSPSRAAETNLELTCSFRLARSVRVQPDLQYVINPGWRADLDNALVAGVRIVFEVMM